MSHEVTIELTEEALSQIFEKLRDNFSFSASGGSPPTQYEIECHLEEGALTVSEDVGIEIKNLKIVWDKVDITLWFLNPLPRDFYLGGHCIIWHLFVGCLATAPKWYPFADSPEYLNVTLSLVGGDFQPIQTSKISVSGPVDTRYHIPEGFDVGMDYVKAQVNEVERRWRIVLVLEDFSMEPLVVDDTVENLLDFAVMQALDVWLGVLPEGDLQDLVLAIMTPLNEVIGDIVGGFPNLANKIAVAVQDEAIKGGLAIFSDLGDRLLDDLALHEIKNPYEVLEDSEILEDSEDEDEYLIPVKVPVIVSSKTHDDNLEIEVRVRALE